MRHDSNRSRAAYIQILQIVILLSSSFFLQVMIPELPSNVTLEQKVDFYRKLWGNLSDQSTTHIGWFSHTRNPAVCWMCDLTSLTSILLHELEEFLTKSSVDLGTASLSEDEDESESDTQIFAEDLGYDEGGDSECL